MNRNSDIEKLFYNAGAEVTIDAKRRKQTLELLSSEIEHKKVVHENNWKQILHHQLYYMDKRVWMINFAMCLALIMLFFFMSYHNVDRQTIVFFSMLMSTLLGSLSMVIICNTSSSGMAELADSCYFNVSQIVLLELTILGIGNLVTLSFAVIFVGIRWDMHLLHIGFYIFVPLLFTEVVSLGALMTEKARRRPYLVIVCGIFSTVIFLILASMPRLFLSSAIVFWAFAFFIGIALLVIEMRKLFNKINEGEILCIG
ncbi:MAG: hypothetical protein ACRC3H_16580 [Lachnospiraceae bacterium]